MKKTLIGMGAMLLVAGSIGFASALTLTDTTYFTSTGTKLDTTDFIGNGRDDVNFLSTSVSQALDCDFDYVTWQHQYAFDPAASINSASLTIWLKDDERDTWNPKTWEFGFGYAENGQWDLGGVDTGSNSYDLDVSTLSDGKFKVTVASILGDFYIKKSELYIDYDPAPVPEPATMLLMGVGLAGLIGYSRKRASKKAL